LASVPNFRFAVSAPDVSSRKEWDDAVRGLESSGFDTVVVADHFTEGWTLEPIVALTAAATATRTIRLQTGVLGNDYRHPVLVHRMAATLDQLSEGRFTLGIGAGWLSSDYHAAGLTLDGPSVRVDRLEESVKVIKALFTGRPVQFSGRYYQISDLIGVPEPCQRPRPPLMMGGGSPRVLRLAGREADLVSIVASLKAGHTGAHSITDLRAEQVDKKVAWIREGVAQRSRGEPHEVTISINHWLVRVAKTVQEGQAFLERVASNSGVDAALLAESPAVLVGTVDQLVDTLWERRERYGISHIQLDAGFAPKNVETLVPLVERLAGV
jgi:probable F420-dependent oxidoreductase